MVRALILARGLGTRMRSTTGDADLTDAQRRAADAGLKAMMPIGQRPFLDFILSGLADAGLSEIGIVVAPDHDLLRQYYTSEAPPARSRLELIVQEQPIGTANAVLAAAAWVRDDPFLVLNGDNLYPTDVLRATAAAAQPALPGFERGDLIRSSNIDAARINAFALIETDAHGYLTRIVEKPRPGEADASALVSMNCWRFDRGILDACRSVPASPRGEYELPMAVGLALAQGMRFQVLPAGGPVLDLSQRADAAEVARRLAGIDPRP
jgi:dTDP-glucose pyrophosphorylase